MSLASFTPSLAAVLVHEGGYCNDPLDPGGATNRGVTQRVYDDWRAAQGLVPRTVRMIEWAEIEAIYRELYWDAIRGDGLPSGVDYCTFDFAVNSGANRAARFLQRVLGVADDGQIGPVTLAAAEKASATHLIDALCDARQAFLEHLPTFGRFGRGWTARVVEVREKAKGMAA